jgi:hypothetical protein
VCHNPYRDGAYKPMQQKTHDNPPSKNHLDAIQRKTSAQLE